MNQRRITRTTRTAIAAGLAAAAVSTAALAAPAQAGTSAGAHHAASAAKGERSLATVLAKDSGFDKNLGDFDVLEAAVGAVLQAKPDSPLAAIADGSQRLTLFAPTDRAFVKLAKLLTGEQPANEKQAFKAIAGAVDIDTLEQVLLYHVVPGATVNSKGVLAAAKERVNVTTAQGGTVGIRPNPAPVRLKDKDPDVPDPVAITKLLDINKGNKQIAHGINRVLLPINL